MEGWRRRTGLLLGEAALKRLSESRVAVLGLGGVGAAAAEGLCRAGVGHLLLVDYDTLEETNLNRQLIATVDTVGQTKTKAARDRLLSIFPQGDFTSCEAMFLPENDAFLFDYKPDYVVDAVDNMTAKLHLAEQCLRRDIRLISAMGTGNRLDPSALRVGDIAQTAGTGCPLARIVRRQLRARGVDRLRVVYSAEAPRRGIVASDARNRHSPGSAPFVPCCAGFLMASVVVRDLTGIDSI
jgi:tRNA A37 threonylcarbamoyladenosine dehydratase